MRKASQVSSIVLVPDRLSRIWRRAGVVQWMDEGGCPDYAVNRNTANKRGFRDARDPSSPVLSETCLFQRHPKSRQGDPHPSSPASTCGEETPALHLGRPLGARERYAEP